MPVSDRMTGYPEDALSQGVGLDVINCHDARTLDELFRERVRRSPEKIAYSQYDRQAEHWYGLTWAEMAREVERWQIAFRAQGLVKGDRVAICFQNSIEWVIFDQAALRLGLIIVPLHTLDRADNLAYALADSRTKLIFVADRQVWFDIADSDADISCVEIVLLFEELEAGVEPAYHKVQTMQEQKLPEITEIASWLPETGQHLERGINEAGDLATIVYTSGTTGRPKGVMLSHKNILSNAYNGMRSVALHPSDRLLSFLPLSHALERTVGYYAAILCGASVTFNRSITELPNDLLEVKPTALVSVPRIFERIHNDIYAELEGLSPIKRGLFERTVKTGWHRFQYQQGVLGWHPRLLASNLLDRFVAKPVRDRLGGNLDFAVVGGAPLSPHVARTFIGLGIPLLQGYGLTECSPVVSVNTKTRNRPDSIGLLLRGVEAKLMKNDELWVKGDNVMLGYWGQAEATSKIVVATESGNWLRTGDRASVDEDGFLHIIGRIKDILVLANGQKVPPQDIEASILRDLLFEQIMIVGEAKAYLSALVVLRESQWQALSEERGWNKEMRNESQVHDLVLQRIAAQMQQFPGYAQIRQVTVLADHWTVESGLLTATLKIIRSKVLQQFHQQIAAMYVGHDLHTV